MTSWEDLVGPLKPGENELLEAATELREAREAAQRAMNSGSKEQMKKALARLQLANQRARKR